MIDRRSFLMQQSALKVCSASKIVQGNAKYMCNKHIKPRNKLAKVQFSAHSFKLTFVIRLLYCLQKLQDFGAQPSLKFCSC